MTTLLAHSDRHGKIRPRRRNVLTWSSMAWSYSSGWRRSCCRNERLLQVSTRCWTKDVQPISSSSTENTSENRCRRLASSYRCSTGTEGSSVSNNGWTWFGSDAVIPLFRGGFQDENSLQFPEVQSDGQPLRMFVQIEQSDTKINRWIGDERPRQHNASTNLSHPVAQGPSAATEGHQ